MTSIDVFVPTLAAYSGRYEQVAEQEWEKGDIRLYNSKGVYWTIGSLSDVSQEIGWVAATHEHNGRPPWEMATWRYYASATGSWVESSEISVRKTDIHPSPALQHQDIPSQRWRVVGGGGAVIRSGESLSSPVVKTLPQGVVLTVVELRGRRARVQHPPGWVSITAATGEVILIPHLADLYSNYSTSPALSPQRTPQTTVGHTPAIAPLGSPFPTIQTSIPAVQHQHSQPQHQHSQPQHQHSQLSQPVLATTGTGESNMQVVLPLKIQYAFNVEVDNRDPNISVLPSDGNGNSKRIVGIEAGIPVLQAVPSDSGPAQITSAPFGNQRPPPVSPEEGHIIDVGLVHESEIPQKLQSCVSNVLGTDIQSTRKSSVGGSVHATLDNPSIPINDAKTLQSENDYFSAPSTTNVSVRSAQEHHSVVMPPSSVKQQSHVTAPSHSTTHVTAPSNLENHQSIPFSDGTVVRDEKSQISIPRNTESQVSFNVRSHISGQASQNPNTVSVIEPEIEEEYEATVASTHRSEVSTRPEMEQTFATAIEQTSSCTQQVTPATPPVSEQRKVRSTSSDTQGSDQSPFPETDIPVAVTRTSDICVGGGGGGGDGGSAKITPQTSTQTQSTKQKSEIHQTSNLSLTGTWYVETKNCGEHPDSSYTIEMWHEPSNDGILRGEYIRIGGGPPLPVQGVYNEKWRVAEIKVSWGAGQTSTMRMHVDQNPPSVEDTAITMRGTFTNDYDRTKGDITAVVVNDRSVPSLHRSQEPITGAAYSELPMPIAVSAEWHTQNLSISNYKLLSGSIERDIAAAIGCDVTQVAIVSSGTSARLRLHSVPGGVPPSQLKKQYELLESRGNLPLPESKATLRMISVSLPVNTPDEYLHPALQRNDRIDASRSPFGTYSQHETSRTPYSHVPSQSPHGMYQNRQDSTSPYGVGIHHQESNFSSPARSSNIFSPIARLSPARPPVC